MLLLSGFVNFDSYYDSNNLLKIKYKFFIIQRPFFFFNPVLPFTLSHSDCGHIIS